MKCFYHREKEAIGVCKSCYRGICEECFVGMKNGISCKGECEQEVRIMNDLFDRDKTWYEKTSKAYFQNAIFLVLAAVVFFIFGIIIIRNSLLGYFMLLMSGTLFIGAIFTFISSKKFGKV